MKNANICANMRVKGRQFISSFFPTWLWIEFLSSLQVECDTKENVFYHDVQQKIEGKCEKFEDNCFSRNMIYFLFRLLFSYFNKQRSANWCMEYEGKATYFKNIDKCGKMRITFFPTYMMNYILHFQIYSAGAFRG